MPMKRYKSAARCLCPTRREPRANMRDLNLLSQFSKQCLSKRHICDMQFADVAWALKNSNCYKSGVAECCFRSSSTPVLLHIYPLFTFTNTEVQFCSKTGNSSVETFSSPASTTPPVQSKAEIVRQSFSRTMWEIFTRLR